MEIQETIINSSLQKQENEVSEINMNPQNTLKKDQQNGQIVDNKDEQKTEILNKIEGIQQNKQGPAKQSSCQIQQMQGKTKHSKSFSYQNKMVTKFTTKTIDRIDEIGEHSSQDYISLTLKLENALQKINNKAKLPNKNSHQGEQFIHRFKQHEAKKKKSINYKKQEVEQSEIKQLKDKPTINHNSQKIVKQIGHKPIYLRVDKMVEEKKRKQQQYQQLKKKQEEQEELNFIQQYKKYVKKPQKLRSYDDYFNQMVRWKQKRTLQNQSKLQEIKSKELDGITFMPALNAKSLRMVKSHQRLPIEQRGLIKRKQKKQVIVVEKKKMSVKTEMNEK